MQDFIERAKQDRVFFTKFRCEIATMLRTIELVELSLGPVEPPQSGGQLGESRSVSARVELQREIGREVICLVEAATQFKKTIGL